MIAAELGWLPLTVDPHVAAAALGIVRTSAHELARTGQRPTPVLRLRHRIEIPTAARRGLLGYNTPPVPAAAHGAV